MQAEEDGENGLLKGGELRARESLVGYWAADEGLNTTLDLVGGYS